MVKDFVFHIWGNNQVWLNLPRDDSSPMDDYHFGYKQKFLKRNQRFTSMTLDGW
jgi:hypothetical protein